MQTSSLTARRRHRNQLSSRSWVWRSTRPVALQQGKLPDNFNTTACTAKYASMLPDSELLHFAGSFISDLQGILGTYERNLVLHRQMFLAKCHNDLVFPDASFVRRRLYLGHRRQSEDSRKHSLGAILNVPSDASVSRATSRYCHSRTETLPGVTVF